MEGRAITAVEKNMILIVIFFSRHEPSLMVSVIQETTNNSTIFIENIVLRFLKFKQIH